MDEMRDPTRDETTTTDSYGAGLVDEPLPGDDTGTTGGWTAGEAGTETGGGRGREWLAQLQAMIDDVATQAAPIARQVGAKAAELAALAAEKAGPAAQRAADVTADASAKLAERAHQAAADLRRGASPETDPGGSSPVWERTDSTGDAPEARSDSPLGGHPS